MTPEVLRILSRLQGSISAQARMVLLSPSREERELFPHARVLTVKDWDLNHEKPDLRADLILASHVFHYARDPALWLRNVAGSCRGFLFVDLVRRRRSADAEWGPDGDCMRYAVGAHRPRVTPCFDLDTLGQDRLLAHHVFDGGSNEYGEALHFIALVRGSLTQPLLRVDGYPAAGGPVPADLEPVHSALEQIDERGLEFVLGVVPALADTPMLRRLRDLRCLVPAQQGGDGNEFAWQRSASVERKLAEGQRVLRSGLGRDVDIYIPHGSRCDRRTMRALERLGFRLCLSEKRVRRSTLPTLRSDFHGGSDELDAAAGLPEVIALDATREARLWSTGRRGSLPHLLDRARDDATRRASR
jgi:hypothetical protein